MLNGGNDKVGNIIASSLVAPSAVSTVIGAQEVVLFKSPTQPRLTAPIVLDTFSIIVSMSLKSKVPTPFPSDSRKCSDRYPGQLTSSQLRNAALFDPRTPLPSGLMQCDLDSHPSSAWKMQMQDMYACSGGAPLISLQGCTSLFSPKIQNQARLKCKK